MSRLSAMKNSHIEEEETKWMRFNNQTFEAEDSIGPTAFNSSGYGFRNTHYTAEVQQNKTMFGLGKDKVFFDPEWDCRQEKNLKDLDPNGKEGIVFRRLGHIYPVSDKLRPEFFPKDNIRNEPLKKVTDIYKVPHSLHEMGLFKAGHFKSLFFTQDYQESGMYHAVVNADGRWESDVVDDFIPVYEHSGKPVWGMDLEQPWQLILMKFWAKRLFCIARDNKLSAFRGGYHGVKDAAVFEFVNAFSNSNWKFYNLSKDLDNFLHRNVNKANYGKFVLKAKNAGFVRESGLIPDEACYQILSIVEDGQSGGGSNVRSSNVSRNSSVSKSGTNKQNRHYIITIQSVNKTTWTGSKSVLDNGFRKDTHLDPNQSKLKFGLLKTEKPVNDDRYGIDRTFSMNEKDLGNLFSCCYVTSRREGFDYYSNFYKLRYPGNQKTALYLQFDMPKDGFFDFSVRQSAANKIKAGDKSRLEMEEHDKEHGKKKKEGDIDRFLRVKYILVKDNSDSDRNEQQKEAEKEYNALRFETYEIEYLKGYNSGDAHFLELVKGRYILRIKSENIPNDAHYIINYCCSENITMREVELDRPQRGNLLRDAMASTIDKTKRVYLNKEKKNETIAFGNLFDYVGYGYVGVKVKKDSNQSVLIDVDPEQLREEGYELKNRFKRETEPFAIVVKPGETTSVVMKKIENEKVPYTWPPKGVGVFQKGL